MLTKVLPDVFRSLCVFVLVAVGSPITHAEPAPCSAAEYGHFDFWVGSWQVHSEDGQLQGHNKISKAEGNCLIVERWTNVQGATGQSYNYYNPADGLWRQLWVSQGAIIDYRGKLTESGAMSLEGHIHYQADGRTADFRGLWTPREDGSVLQAFHERDAQSGEWVEWFTGVYTRRADASP